ncbi:MAG: hypothetical protein DMC60_08805 [Verrucomicrobia bacterium]|nr:MAG: hypothetical protein DMC60_08805 [Verrucomicrobiota bacterium]
MRTALCFAILPIPTLALSQGATPAKRPTVGAKPLVQVMPRARYPCTFGSCARQPFASNPPHDAASRKSALRPNRLAFVFPSEGVS